MGKTSLLRKIISNDVEDTVSDIESIASISQEMMKHTLISETNEEVKVVFVSIKTSLFSDILRDL